MSYVGQPPLSGRLIAPPNSPFALDGGPPVQFDFMGGQSLGKAGWKIARTGRAWGVGPGGLLHEWETNRTARHRARDNASLVGVACEEQSTNEAFSPAMEGAKVGVVGSGGELPTGWNFGFNSAGAILEVLEIGSAENFTFLRVAIRDCASVGQVNIDMAPNNVAPCVNGDWYALGFYLSREPHPTKGVDRIQSAHAWYNSTQNFLSSKIGPNVVDSIGEAGPMGGYRYQSVQQCNEANAAFAMPQLITGISNPATAYIEYRIAIPTFERRAFLTSPVLVRGTPRERTVCELFGAVFSNIWNETAMTVVMRGTVHYPTADNAFPRVLEVSDGTANNRWSFIYTDTGGARIDSAVHSGGLSQWAGQGNFEVPDRTPFELAFAFRPAANRFVFFGNGQKLFERSTAYTAPVGVDRLTLYDSGAPASNQGGNGIALGLDMWPGEDLSDEALAALTA